MLLPIIMHEAPHDKSDAPESTAIGNLSLRSATNQRSLVAVSDGTSCHRMPSRRDA